MREAPALSQGAVRILEATPINPKASGWSCAANTYAREDASGSVREVGARRQARTRGGRISDARPGVAYGADLRNL